MQFILTWSKYLWFTGLVFILSSCQEQSGKQALVVGLSPDYPPFEFYQQEKLTGFDVELVQKIAQSLNVELIIKNFDYCSLVTALKTGQVDIVISSMAITEERKKNVAFSHEYFHDTLALIYKKSSPLLTTQDMTHKKIGAQLGSTMHYFVEKCSQSIPDITLVKLNANTQLVEKLKIGHLDGIVMDKLQAHEFCQKNPILGYTIIGESNEGYAIACSPGSPWLEKINTILQRLKDSGFLVALEKKWTGDKKS